jgi:hypothetical protein
MILAGETEVLGENLPSATLPTTNPTWIDPGARTRASAVRGQRLTAWAMARPHNYLSFNNYFVKYFKLVYIKNVVMLTSATGIMFLLFTCMHFWVRSVIRRWPACVPTACEVFRDCQKFEKHWSTDYCFIWRCSNFRKHLEVFLFQQNFTRKSAFYDEGAKYEGLNPVTEWLSKSFPKCSLF